MSMVTRLAITDQGTRYDIDLQERSGETDRWYHLSVIVSVHGHDEQARLRAEFIHAALLAAQGEPTGQLEKSGDVWQLRGATAPTKGVCTPA